MSDIVETYSAQSARSKDRWRTRTALGYVGLSVFSVVVSCVITIAHGWPRPSVHDEFSYLLAADTFAHGRLTNPTPVGWKHFQTFHVLLRPTYMSKYPPAQGAMLALGSIAGHPILGVWLITALAAAAVAWCVAGWLDVRWGLIAGLAVSLHPVVLAWSQSYWGGSLPLLGGALVAGALPRLAAAPARTRDLIALAIGFAILAFSRPYEGLLVAVPATVYLIACGWLATRRARVRLLLAIAIAALSIGGFQAYYNLRVTGSAARFPYVEYDAQYSGAPALLIQRSRPIPDAPREMSRLGEIFRRAFDRDRARPWETIRGTLVTFVRTAVPKFESPRASAWIEAVRRALLVPWIILPLAVWRQRSLRYAALAIALFLTGCLLVSWTHPHYLAPIGGFAAVAFFGALRWLIDNVRGQKFLVAVFLGAFLVLAAFGFRHVPAGDRWPARSEIARQLLKQPGDHLVFVRYEPGFVAHKDWVCNAADLNASRILWARELSPADDAMLIRQYPGRQVWVLENAGKNPRLMRVIGARHDGGEGSSNRADARRR